MVQHLYVANAKCGKRVNKGPIVALRLTRLLAVSNFNADHSPRDCVTLYIPYSYWGRTIYILSAECGPACRRVSPCISNIVDICTNFHDVRIKFDCLLKAVHYRLSIGIRATCLCQQHKTTVYERLVDIVIRRLTTHESAQPRITRHAPPPPPARYVGLYRPSPV